MRLLILVTFDIRPHVYHQVMAATWKLENGEWWYYPKGKRQRGFQRECQRCGIEFRTRIDVPYCSTRCALDSKEPLSKEPVSCSACGTPFVKKNWHQHMCSRKCMGETRRGSDHPKWGGGRIKDARSGYISVLAAADDPIGWPMRRTTHNYVFEHRLLMARHLGRSLTRQESVHHINGVKDDNRLENLELWSKSHPEGQNVEDKVAWAKQILAQYGDYVPPSGQKRLT
jgi:hypothetical protein